MVEPVDVLEGGVLDLVPVLPWSPLSDEFGLVEADDGLGEGRCRRESPTEPTDGEMPASASRLV